jgi:hypothetical protein
MTHDDTLTLAATAVNLPEAGTTEGGSPMHVLRDLVAGGTPTTLTSDLASEFPILPPVIVGSPSHRGDGR